MELNCYLYMLQKNNIDISSFKDDQPGSISGKLRRPFDKKIFLSAVQADLDKLGYSIVEISKEEITNNSVAIVFYNGIYLQIDYHWYIYNSEDNSWWHKSGHREIKNTDNSGNIIVDPANCNMKQYNEFVGYFNIVPQTRTELTLELCAGRHQTPATDSIFPNTVNPFDFKQMEVIVKNKLMFCKKLDLYVTGLTTALITVVNYCNNNNIELTLYHYNKDNDGYVEQKIN